MTEPVDEQTIIAQWLKAETLRDADPRHYRSQAIEAYQLLLSLLESNPVPSQISLQKVRADLQRLQSAQASEGEALETSTKLPDSANPAEKLGKQYLSQYRFAEAEEVCRQLVRIAPTIEHHILLLTTLVCQNRLDEAITYWESLRGTPVLAPKVIETDLSRRGVFAPIVSREAEQRWRYHYCDLLEKKAIGYVFRRKNPPKVPPKTIWPGHKSPKSITNVAPTPASNAAVSALYREAVQLLNDGRSSEAAPILYRVLWLLNAMPGCLGADRDQVIHHLRNAGARYP